MFIELSGQLCNGKLYKVIRVSSLIYFKRRAENYGPVHGAAIPQKHIHVDRSSSVEQARSIAHLVTMSLSLCHTVIHHPWCMNPPIILKYEMRRSLHLCPLYTFVGVWGLALNRLATTHVAGLIILFWYLRSITPFVPRLCFYVTRRI